MTSSPASVAGVCCRRCCSPSRSRRRWRTRRWTPASSSTRPKPDVLRLAPPLIISATQVDAFLAVLPGLLDDRGDRDEPATFPAGRRHQRGGADGDPGPGGRARREAVPASAVRRSADRGGALRQGLDPDPDLLRGRYRGAGRTPDDHGLCAVPTRPRRADRRHRAGARPACRRRRLADLRSGAVWRRWRRTPASR